MLEDVELALLGVPNVCLKTQDELSSTRCEHLGYSRTMRMLVDNVGSGSTRVGGDCASALNAGGCGTRAVGGAQCMP